MNRLKTKSLTTDVITFEHDDHTISYYILHNSPDSLTLLIDQLEELTKFPIKFTCMQPIEKLIEMNNLEWLQKIKLEENNND